MILEKSWQSDSIEDINLNYETSLNSQTNNCKTFQSTKYLQEIDLFLKECRAIYLSKSKTKINNTASMDRLTQIKCIDAYCNHMKALRDKEMLAKAEEEFFARSNVDILPLPVVAVSKVCLFKGFNKQKLNI